MSQVIPGSFRGANLGLPQLVNVADAVQALGSAPGRTPGAVLLDRVPLAPALTEKVTVTAWALSCGLVLSRLQAQLAPPANLNATVRGGGGWAGATGTYFWKVTAVNATGETTGSNETSAFVKNGSLSPTLSWDAVIGATSYKLYRSTTSGGEGTSPALVVAGGGISFIDTGAAPGVGAVPATNTTTSVSATTQFGRLGRLIAGPIRDAQPSQAATVPWSPAFVFPSDISNLAPLWDGAADPPPPIEQWSNPMPIHMAANLASPIELYPGEQLAMMLALTPTVGQNVALYALGGQWALTYETAPAHG